ncbi:hypothetical protein [Streptomyces sp. NPDC126499]|uniref:hypothetical protein n=1 Tax=Streptomyces sp. NPDC126499 TaxID=3155314 RepID=UPI0033218F2C
MAATPQSILATYAAPIAAVVRQAPATELVAFAEQVMAASEELLDARIEGSGLLDIAAGHLFDAETTPQSLATADHYLAKAADQVGAYLTARNYAA